MNAIDETRSEHEVDVERPRTLNYSTVEVPLDQRRLLATLNEIEHVVGSDLSAEEKRARLEGLHREADELLARALDPDNPDGIVSNHQRPYPWLAAVLRSFVHASKGEFLRAAEVEEVARHYAEASALDDLLAMNESNMSDSLRRAAAAMTDPAERARLLRRAIDLARTALERPRGQADPAIMIIAALGMIATGDIALVGAADALFWSVAGLVGERPQDVVTAHGLHEAELAAVADVSPGARQLIDRAVDAARTRREP